MQRLLHAIADGQGIDRWRLAAVLVLIVTLAACALEPETEGDSPTLEEAEARAAAGDYTALGEYYEAQDELERNPEAEEFTCPRGNVAVCARVSQFNTFEHCVCVEEEL